MGAFVVVWGPHPMVLWGYFWLCTPERLLGGLGALNGMPRIELVCKAS